MKHAIRHIHFVGLGGAGLGEGADEGGERVLGALGALRLEQRGDLPQQLVALDRVLGLGQLPLVDGDDAHRVAGLLEAAAARDDAGRLAAHLAHALKDAQRRGVVGVADRGLDEKAVELRFGQLVGARLLDRVLRRDDEERATHLVWGAVDRHAPLFHDLEQRGLRLGARAVDLVADHDVRKHRPRLELKLTLRLVVDGDTRDVCGQQVGGELDATDRAIDGPRHRAGQHRFAHAGHVLDEQVTLREEHRERHLDRGVLAIDHRADAAENRSGAGVELVVSHHGGLICEVGSRIVHLLSLAEITER